MKQTICLYGLVNKHLFLETVHGEAIIVYFEEQTMHPVTHPSHSLV